MLIVDDHLAILAIAGALPDFSYAAPVATTYCFHYRMARAASDSDGTGSLSRRLAESSIVLSRILKPPAHRLLVLDPRVSIEAAVDISASHGANLLLAELVGAAIFHGASVRVTPANEGRAWSSVMAAAGVDFATVEP